MSEQPVATTLVSPETLRAHLADPQWIVCDCRHDLADYRHGRRAYEAAHIPGARFELFEGVAHMVNLEQPERFTRLVLDFLADAGIGQPAEATGAAALT